jgi:hypothetical protein
LKLGAGIEDVLKNWYFFIDAEEDMGALRTVA